MRTTTPDPEDDTLARIVAEPRSSSRLRSTWRLGVAAAVILVALALLGLRPGAHRPAVEFRTQTVIAGDLTITVSATGHLEPTNQVDVGSEVSGLVEKVFVDDNDRVTSAEVLARLDTSTLEDQVATARASLASAEARVLEADASVVEAEATLARLERVAELSGGKVPSATELENAQATVARARAEEASARAAVEQSRAALRSALTKLDKASIQSPIDGVVLARQIEPGQTVAASFQAPVLFTIAEDLSEMELEVDVDEADVGQVREGQQATFTVDAYPDRSYPAVIRRVGFGSEITDGVVTYPAVLTVDNDDLSLRPGMTASAEITTTDRSNVLLVPNSALRFEPPTRPEGRSESGNLLSRLIPRPPRGGRRATQATSDSSGRHRVWVLSSGHPVPVEISPGATDGRHTEVLEGPLAAGDEVIVESTTGSS